LSNLEDLYLYDNQLCGEIPSELMKLTNLHQAPYGLKLQNNNLINTDTAYPANFDGLIKKTRIGIHKTHHPTVVILVNQMT